MTTIIKKVWTHYGLDVLEVGNREYAIAFSESDLDSAINEYVLDTICYFDSNFLSDFCVLPSNAIKILQENMNESELNDVLLDLIHDNLDDLVESAIGLDGYGHFLSHYDGVMIETDLFELSIDDESIYEEIMNNYDLRNDQKIYLFRIN